MNTTRHTHNGLLWLFVIALSLCLCLGAVAEPGTIFPWLSYTLDVALVTADPQVVDFKDAPSDGAMVMVKLVSDYGTVQTDDIKEHSEAITLRDQEDNEYQPYSYRIRGVDFDSTTGLFSTKPEQDGFELLYFLEGKDESAVTGATLVVPTDKEGENILVALDKAPHKAADRDAAAERTEEGAPTAASFVLGGIRYTISALEDTPALQLPNHVDGKEGHAVAFSYLGSGTEAENANKQLYSGAQLREPNGDLVTPYSNSDNIGNPYELYFGLSDNVLLQDCVFIIQSDAGEVEIQLSTLTDGAAQSTESQTTTATVAPTPTPIPSVAPSDAASDMERMIEDVLTRCAQDVKDEWQLAIYHAGVKDVQADPAAEGVYTFLLRSFDPGLKELGKYQDDNRTGYLNRLLDNTKVYNLAVSLTLNDGTFTDKSVKALQSAVKKAAASSQKAFKDKGVLKAFADELVFSNFPSGIKNADDLYAVTTEYAGWQINHSSTLSSLNALQWVPFFYGQNKQVLDVTGGPFALKLKCTGVDMAVLLENAQADALKALMFMNYDRRWDNNHVETEFRRALAENVITMRKKGKESATITLNVDGSPADDSAYQDMLSTYAYEDALNALKSDAEDLPDEAALAFPKAGWMSGSTRGTQVRIKAPKDSVAYYVQLRNYNTDEVAVAGFVQPGSTCTLRLPKGDYYFVMASGYVWYGEEKLFGDATDFTKTGLFEVLGSNYYHIVTLKVTENGNMPIYGADEGDLQN